MAGRLSSGTVKSTLIGCDLGDHDEAVGVARRDVVALVDLTQPDPAVERRDDLAVGEVDLGRFDLARSASTVPWFCATSAIWVSSC